MSQIYWAHFGTGWELPNLWPPENEEMQNSGVLGHPIFTRFWYDWCMYTDIFIYLAFPEYGSTASILNDFCQGPQAQPPQTASASSKQRWVNDIWLLNAVNPQVAQEATPLLCDVFWPGLDELLHPQLVRLHPTENLCSLSKVKQFVAVGLVPAKMAPAWNLCEWKNYSDWAPAKLFWSKLVPPFFSADQLTWSQIHIFPMKMILGEATRWNYGCINWSCLQHQLLKDPFCGPWLTLPEQCSKCRQEIDGKITAQQLKLQLYLARMTSTHIRSLHGINKNCTAC